MNIGVYASPAVAAVLDHLPKGVATSSFRTT
jgi:hypothetical protein